MMEGQRTAALELIFSEPQYSVLDEILLEIRDKAIDGIIKEKDNAPALLRAVEEVRIVFRAYHLNCGRR